MVYEYSCAHLAEPSPDLPQQCPDPLGVRHGFVVAAHVARPSLGSHHNHPLIRTTGRGSASAATRGVTITRSDTHQRLQAMTGIQTRRRDDMSYSLLCMFVICDRLPTVTLIRYPAYLVSGVGGQRLQADLELQRQRPQHGHLARPAVMGLEGKKGDAREPVRSLMCTPSACMPHDLYWHHRRPICTPHTARQPIVPILIGASYTNIIKLVRDYTDPSALPPSWARRCGRYRPSC